MKNTLLPINKKVISEISASLQEAKQTLEVFAADSKNLETICTAVEKLAEVIGAGGKIISCGNGGSMSDAMHFAEELTARFKRNRLSLPAIAISDAAYLTCTGNDYGFDRVFSRFVEGMGNPGDVLLGISTSGNSENVIRAVEMAKEKKMFSLVLTGKDGGKLKSTADLSIVVPSQHTERIQEIHIKVIHILIDQLEKILESKGFLSFQN